MTVHKNCVNVCNTFRRSPDTSKTAHANITRGTHGHGKQTMWLLRGYFARLSGCDGIPVAIKCALTPVTVRKESESELEHMTEDNPPEEFDGWCSNLESH